MSKITDAVALLKSWKSPTPGKNPPGLDKLHLTDEEWTQVVGAANGRAAPWKAPTPRLLLMKGTQAPHARPFDPKRGPWKNYVLQHSTEVRWAVPVKIAEVEALVAAALKSGGKVKAVGSGHAAGDVSQPNEGEVAVVLDGMVGVRKAPNLLKVDRNGNPIDAAHLVYCAAGTRIHEVNARLAALKLGLPNMGSYDGQTVAGALGTGTHGSGYALPALAACVRSIRLVAVKQEEDGTRRPCTYQIERTLGVTDRKRFQRTFPTGELIQDDATFDAAVISFGSMGVIVGLILQVMDRYELTQHSTCASWSDVKGSLDAMVAKSGDRHVEFYINPVPTWQPNRTWDHTVLITRRNLADPGMNRSPEQSRRIACAELLDLSSPALSVAASGAARGDHGKTLDSASLYGLRINNYTNWAPQVLLLPAGNDALAKSTEFIVPYVDTVTAVDTVLATLRAEAAAGGPVNSPIGVRFVAPTPGHLSPFRWPKGEASCTIETPCIMSHINPTNAAKAWDSLLKHLIQAMKPLGARTHWGQYSQLTHADVVASYGIAAVNAWSSVRRRFDPTGVFTNPFLHRAGL